jgi:hypothetical protein
MESVIETEEDLVYTFFKFCKTWETVQERIYSNSSKSRCCSCLLGVARLEVNSWFVNGSQTCEPPSTFLIASTLLLLHLQLSYIFLLPSIFITLPRFEPHLAHLVLVITSFSSLAHTNLSNKDFTRAISVTAPRNIESAQQISVLYHTTVPKRNSLRGWTT